MELKKTMCVTFLENEQNNNLKIRLFFKDSNGNDVSVDLSQGETVFSETDFISNQLRIYSKRGVDISYVKKPESLQYFIPYKKEDVDLMCIYGENIVEKNVTEENYIKQRGISGINLEKEILIIDTINIASVKFDTLADNISNEELPLPNDNTSDIEISTFIDNFKKDIPNTIGDININVETTLNNVVCEDSETQVDNIIISKNIAPINYIIDINKITPILNTTKTKKTPITKSKKKKIVKKTIKAKK